MPVSLFRISMILLVLLTGLPISAQTTTNTNANQLPLSAYSYPMSGWVGWFGPESASTDWQTRKVLADVLDATMWTPNIQQHPLLDPQLGPFVSLFHHARVWHGIDELAHDPAPAAGIRLGKWYSSGWTLQFRQASGHNFTVMVDFSDGPFGATPTTPNLVPLETLQLDALANNIDAYFITHSHIDHVSPYLVSRMLQLGKLVVAPLEVKVQALLAGYPMAQAIVAPTSTAPMQFGPLTFTTFNGWQYGEFLDPPANTVPNVNHPFNVENNAYMFNLNGVTVAHFGDNNDPGIIPFVMNCLQSGWQADVCLNVGTGPMHTTIQNLFAPQIRFLTHELEFHHLGSSFLQLNLNQNGPQHLRRVLLWGEHLDFEP